MEKAILDGEPRPFIPSEKTADVDKAFAFLGKCIGENGQQASHEDKDMLAGQLFMADAGRHPFPLGYRPASQYL